MTNVIYQSQFSQSDNEFNIINIINDHGHVFYLCKHNKWKQQKKQNKQKQKTNMICSFFKELLVKNSKQKESAKSAL